MTDTNTFIDNAINTARAWLVAECAESVELFDAHVDDDCLSGAVNVCLEAGGDSGGFADLDELTDIIGERIEFNSSSEADGFKVLGFDRLYGRWTVVCAWDGDVNTTEDCNILRDSGAIEV